MSTGGSHTAFNGGAIVGAGLGAGLSIGGALLQGVANHRASVANQRRQERINQWEKRAIFFKEMTTILQGRLNREVDTTRTQALAIEALRKENQRLRGF